MPARAQAGGMTRSGSPGSGDSGSTLRQASDSVVNNRSAMIVLNASRSATAAGDSGTFQIPERTCVKVTSIPMRPPGPRRCVYLPSRNSASRSRVCDRSCVYNIPAAGHSDENPHVGSFMRK